MKKIMLSIMLVISINGVYGMEVRRETVKTFVCPIFPKIIVVQDDIYDRRTPNADITIVGETEQIVQLKNAELYPSPLIGCMQLNCKSIMKRSKVFTQYFDPSYEGNSKDSAAIIVDGERFIITNLRKHVEKKKMEDRCLIVREPQVWYVPSKDDLSVDNQYVYMREFRGKGVYNESHTYKGSEAIEEAVKDLRSCYKSVLIMSHDFFTKENTARSLALPQLSVSLGIPAYRAAHVAVTSVIEFLKQNKDTYGLIEFVVLGLEDFNLYKNLLIEHATELIEKKAAGEI